MLRLDPIKSMSAQRCELKTGTCSTPMFRAKCDDTTQLSRRPKTIQFS